MKNLTQSQKVVSWIWWAYMWVKAFILPRREWMSWSLYKGWRDQGEEWADGEGVRHPYI